MRFQRVPGQIADEVPAGSGDSGANSREGSGGFRGRKLMRSRGFRCKWLMRFQEVPGQMAKILPRSFKLLGITNDFILQQRKLMGSSAQISSGVCRCGSQEQVPEEGSGRFRRVPVCAKVPEGSGGFRCVLV